MSSNRYNRNRRDYVPKWKQEENAKKAEEDARVKSIENTEDNFPSLGGKMTAPKQSWSTGTASFRDLASEWRQKDEMEKVNADLTKSETLLYPDIVLPKFNNVHRYTDDGEKNAPEEDEAEKPSVKEETNVDLDIGHTEEDDGWVTVQHKKPPKDKSAKKSEEIQKLTEEDFEASSQGSDTVWNAHLASGPRGKNMFG